MNTLILLQIFLVLHLIGLTLMAGTTVAEFIIFGNFAKMYDNERQRSLSLLEVMKKLSMLLGLGGALLILSGIGLFTVTGGAFAHQIWFKIKLSLILVLILNGFLVGGRQELKLKTSINANDRQYDEQIKRPILNLKIFYLVQMGIFFVIIILSVFKIN
ncbi:hypothetical protein ACPPVU_13180 [Mucilaginibacter sp. McL0603]|uniref:hypothetical protein n=1 Tax=Mucilaginibacter sp. McL0603 TaxID=3415670 RepID=UPI003CEC9CF7